ncbi:MAG: class I SAM-dependent methyltransferase [Verrucomicrobiota bacterium]|nr:class I SAM-dependent methyltransferase [Verrucomicrobiota bacterium]
MGAEIIHAELPSRHFEPRLYGVGAWTSHLHFAYDLVAVMKPRVLVELGVDRGESYFAFCQSAAENKTGTRCFGVDSWQGDQHAGGYDETTFAQVSAHNRANYGAFSTLTLSTFDAALAAFEPESIDVLHLDGLHTEAAVRHDLESWLPKIQPGGIVLLHDVEVRSRDFGVWKVWAELQNRNRSWTFRDGPGLGVWQKPPAQNLVGFLDQLLAPPNEQNEILAQYYRDCAAGLQRRIGEQWRDGTIRQTPFAQQTIVQVFYTKDGAHRDEDSVCARIGHEGWKEVAIQLPPGAGASPLRIDFCSALTTIEIESIRLTMAGHVQYAATDEQGFNAISLAGDVERMPHPNALQLAVTGVDPQLHLPPIELSDGEGPLMLQMRLKVLQR